MTNEFRPPIEQPPTRRSLNAAMTIDDKQQQTCIDGEGSLRTVQDCDIPPPNGLPYNNAPSATTKKGGAYHAAVYWLGRMAARSLSIILLPIYTAYIAPAEFGELSILAMVIDVAALVVSLQLPAAIYRFWALSDNVRGQARVLGSSMTVSLIVPMILFLPVYIWAGFFSRLLSLESDHNLLRLVLLECQFAIVVTLLVTEMRVREESSRFAFWDVSSIAVTGVLSVVLIAGYGMGLWGMFVAQTVVFGGTVAILLPQFLRRVELCFDWPVVRKMLAFALPLVPSAVAMAAVHTSDRFFIMHIAGPEATGIYALGYKFGTLVSILVTGPFLLIWEPRQFAIAKDPNATLRFGRIFTLFLALTSVVAIALTAMSREIVRIMSAPQYTEASTVIPLVAWSYVFFGLSTIVCTGLYVGRKTVTASLLVMVAFVTNAFGNVLLIPRFGPTGAAWSTLLSFALLFLLNLTFAKRHLAIAFETRKLIILGCLVLLAMASMLVLPTMNAAIGVPIKSAMLVSYAYLLYRFGHLDELHIAQKASRIADYIRDANT